MPTVRVTMFEDPIEIPEDEVEVLRAQGLLHEDPAPQTPRPATSKAPAKKDGE